MDTKEYIKGYFKERAVAFPDFYKKRPLLPIEAYIVSRVQPSDTVLDLCCGGGEVSLAIAQKGTTVTGIDNVPDMCCLCQELFTEKKQTGYFHVGDATRLPFNDSIFSCVVCTGNSLNSMSNQDAEKTILEAARVTKPDGILYLTVLNPMSIRNLLAVARGILQRAPAWGFYYRSSYGLQVDVKEAPRGMSFLIPPLRIKRYLRNAGLEYESSRWDTGFTASHLLLTCRKRHMT